MARSLRGFSTIWWGWFAMKVRRIISAMRSDTLVNNAWFEFDFTDSGEWKRLYIRNAEIPFKIPQRLSRGKFQMHDFSISIPLAIFLVSCPSTLAYLRPSHHGSVEGLEFICRISLTVTGHQRHLVVLVLKWLHMKSHRPWCRPLPPTVTIHTSNSILDLQWVWIGLRLGSAKASCHKWSLLRKEARLY